MNADPATETSGGTPDHALLRQFVQQRSEAAFAQIVRRHYALVYATCKRELEDAELAQDVSQIVFLLLARKAPVLRGGEGLAGWLFQTARFASKNALRQERRRRQREGQEQAAFQHQYAAGAAATPSAAWESIEPRLNDALGRLKPEDREAVLLRFCEDHSLADVGHQLGISENTARMRITRALDKMRRSLSMGSAALDAAALAGLLTEKNRAAPVPLPPQSIALGAKSAHVQFLMQGVLKTMKLKTAATLAGTVAVVALVAFPLVAAASKWVGTPAKTVRAAAQPFQTALNAPSLHRGQTVSFALDQNSHADYHVSLPPGPALVVLDMRRADGRQADARGATNSDAMEARGTLSYFDPSGRPALVESFVGRNGQSARGDSMELGFENGENRLVSRLSLDKPASIIVDVRNQGVRCAYWLTVLPAVPALSASTASPALHVPLFGSTTPNPMALGQSETGRLTKNGYAYFSLPLSAGDYRASLEFRNVSGHVASLNGEMLLSDENGAMNGGFNKGINQLHVDTGTEPPYSNEDTFTLKKGGVLLLSVSNDGSDPPDTGDDAVTFTACITPAGAAKP